MAKRYGRWETVGSIGEGGQAAVFLVKDTQKAHEGTYALKRLKNPERIDLFEREVEATQALRHPNVLRVVDADLKASPPYYVAEYCEGGSLQKIGADTFRGDIDAALKVLLPIANALHTAEFMKGVVHRDVKPANILLRADGSPVIGDFGICHMEGDQRVTLTDEAMGPTNYIAPEMESGKIGPVTDRVDVYALGKVLYWMLSGGLIFAREDHRGSGRYLPKLLEEERWEHVHALLDRMITVAPNSRLGMGEVRERCEETARLVKGNFMPLRPSMGLTCRLCGIDRYEKYAGGVNAGSPRSADWFFGTVGDRGDGRRVTLLRCNHCGHVEWFDFQNIADQDWWTR